MLFDRLEGTGDPAPRHLELAVSVGELRA
jgi:hypothetical protein